MKHRQLKTLSRAVTSLILFAYLLYSAPGSAPVHAAPGDITRVSVSSGEIQANGRSWSADISGGGRFVVFRSDAGNLVPGDTNGGADIFVRDGVAGETTRISVSSTGAQANEESYFSAISADGRFVTFSSDASNLVPGDTNGFTDIFLRDRQAGTTVRVSVGPNGVQANGISDSYVAISGDGRFVTFNSDATNLVSGDTNGVADVFVYDRLTDTTERVSLDSNELQSNGASTNPSISGDGRFVAFNSDATNLVSGDTNTRTDVFVRDRQAGVTTRVTVNSSGVQADRGGRDPSISANGRFVAFSSLATNLLNEEPYGYEHVYVHDRQTGATTLASIETTGWQLVGTATTPDISADGRYVTYEFDDRGDGLGFWAIYLHDRLTGVTMGISGPGGSEEDSSFGPAISNDGRFVAFASLNRRLVTGDTNETADIFLRELAVTTPVVKTYQSVGANDGWVIEGGEETEVGVRIDERANTFFLGDGNNDQQYRSLLDFGTGSLPNNAVITSVTLKIKRQSLVGENPFTTHGNLLVDVRKPYFDSAPQLQVSDFQASADRQAVGAFTNVPGGLWYTANLDPSAFSFINRIGATQFRLRFALGDNDDNEQDLVKFFSGDAAATDQPVLTINYFLNSSSDPSVLGIQRLDANPSTAASVRFTVAFSEPVTGVDGTDFRLTTSDGISGAAVLSVSGTGDTYTVTAGTGTGSGTLRLDLIDNDSIQDLGERQLGGAGPGNGDFTSGEAYTIGKPTAISVYVGGTLQGTYTLNQNQSTRQSYLNTNDGPVRITGTVTHPIIAAERVIYNVNSTATSFTEMMALPDSQLDTVYWLPWYNNVDLDTQLRFANASGTNANVQVLIGGHPMPGSPFILAPGESIRKSFTGINAGPVQIVSSQKIVAAERVIYKVNGISTSFSEIMALPNSQLDSTYWLPWYNNVDLDTELRVANTSASNAIVHVYIGGNEMTGSPLTLAPGESRQQRFANINNGPVKIVSDQQIVATERVIYAVNGVGTSFSEMMALPNSQLDTVYWLPYYNNVDLDTQLRIANVSNLTATLHVYVGGIEVPGSPFLLVPGESTRKSFSGVSNGPVKIVSDQNIVAAERVIYKVNGISTSFSEMMGLPGSLLDSTYWLPWYNNVDLDTQLRFGVP